MARGALIDAHAVRDSVSRDIDASDRMAGEVRKLLARDTVDAGGGTQPEIAAAIFDDGMDDLGQPGG